MPSKIGHRLLGPLLAAGVACSAQSPAQPDAIAGYTKLDDMEVAGLEFTWTSASGLASGRWFAATDCIQGHSIEPPSADIAPDDWRYAELEGLNERFQGMLSTHAARLRTIVPLTNTWGANMGINLYAGRPARDGGSTAADPAGIDGGAITDWGDCPQDPLSSAPNAPVDLTPYSGVSFWAKSASYGGKVIHVQVLDANADPRGGTCDPATDGCYNGFSAPVFVTDSFARYEVNFADLLRDPAWGYHPKPDILDLRRTYAVSFAVRSPHCVTTPETVCADQFPPTNAANSLTFDFWIDDIYLVNRR